MTRADLEDTVDVKDGLDVILRIGNDEGGLKLDTRQKRTLTYRPKSEPQ